MEGKTNRRFDGMIEKLRQPGLRKKAGRFGALTIAILLLVALIGNGAFPRTILGETGSTSATRLWSSGAELNSTTNGVEFTSSSGTKSISSSTVRSGTYSYRANPTSSTGIFVKQFASSNQSAKFWFRTYLRIATTPSASTYVVQIGNSGGGKISVRLTTSDTLQLRNEEDNNDIGSASSALSTGTWYRVEVYVDTTTLSSTDAELRIDGVSISSSTAENIASGIDRMSWGSLTSGTTDLFFDDIAINNSSARSQGNWPGEGKIVHLKPNATGDNSENWGSGGTPADCDATGDPDWQCLDEVTPDDATSELLGSTNGAIDDFNIESSSTPGIAANDKIKLVQIGNRFIRCAAGAGGPGFNSSAVKKVASLFVPKAEAVTVSCPLSGNNTSNAHKVRIKAAASGTVEESSSITDTNSSTWATNDNSVGNYALTLYDLPGSSTAPWTPSDLDTAQIGLNLVTADPGTIVSTEWLLVEYVPVTGGRIWSSGFELQDVGSTPIEYTGNIGTAPTVDTTNQRSGAAAIKTSSSAATSGWEFDFASANQVQDYYFRAYVRVATAPGTLTNIMEFYDSANTVQASIRMNTDRTLELWNDEDSTQIGSDSSAIAATTWTRLEIRLNCSSTCAGSGSATLDARIDGTSFASSSTVNHANGIMTIRAGVLTSTTADFSWDDVALNQAIGTTQNSWPGEGKIVHLRPSADDSTNTAWTNGFANVDEVTPNDATDLVSETTADDIDDYDIDNASLTGSDTVNVVSVGVRFNTSSATQEDFRVRLKDSSSGIAIESNTLSPASTTWTTNATASPKLYPLTAYTLPEQSSAWTDTTLDSAQVGLRDVLSSTGTVQVTAEWLLVDYTEPQNINISGTCDQYDQSTDCSDDGSNSIAVAVDGTLQGQSDSTVDGSWQITGVTPPSNGAIITVFINGETTDDEEAVAVTKYDGTGDITGVTLFQRHLSLGSADNQTLSNSDIDAYDNSVSSDEDIFFDVSAGNDLTVDSLGSYTDEELYVVSGNTYRPASGGGADVTTVHIENDGTFSADSNSITVSGSWQNDGTFTAGTSTVTMSSTTTGRTLSGTMTSSSAFYDLTFNGSGGAWSFSAAAETDRDFTITNGTVTAPSGNLTVARNFTNDGTFTHNSGTVILDTTTTATVSSSNSGTTFNNFTSTAATKTIQFEKHSSNVPVFTFAGTFTITGTAGNLINLYSDTSGTQWKAHFNSSQTTVTYVNLRDGGCDSGTSTVYMDATSTSVSNNDICWHWPVNRLWTGGAELQSSTAEVETNFNDGSAFSISTSTKRSGDASWRINPSSSQAAFNKYFLNTPTQGKYWARVYIYIATTPGTEIGILNFNGAAERLGVRMNSDRTLELWDEEDNVQIGSASSALSTNTWYRVEMYGDTTTLSSTSAELRLNGSSVTSGTANLAGAFDRIQWGALNANSTTDLFFDDIAVNGPSSASNNWPGDGKIVHMQPNGDGDNVAWSDLGGNSIDYDEVDEVTPDDNTTYISSTSASQLEDLDLESSSNAGIGGSDTISLVSVGLRFKECTSGGPACIVSSGDNYKARIKASSGGTLEESSSINADNASSYNTNYNSSSATANLYPLTLYDVPGSSTAAWTTSNLDSTQIGMNHVSEENGFRTTTMWLLVEYIPANQNPDTPTSLIQKKTTGGATLATGDWTNETTVTFEATATDPDSSDTLYLCVEKDILGTSFSNTEDSCGSGVAYSGSGVSVTVTIGSQTDASEYHWQARIKDAGGLYSGWLSYGGNAESARDYGIDTTACTYGGSVYDGTVEDVDAAYNDGSLTSLSANWDAFTCTVSGLNKYQYSVGTTVGGTDIKTWTDNSTNESVTATSLVLRTNQTYYVNVRAVDNAANTSSVTSSNGQDVLPTISMSLSGSSITFAELNAGNNRSDTETITTTSSTNAYSGYVIRQYASGLLTAGSNTIPMFQGGTYASPAAWGTLPCTSGSNCGYGYTSNDTTIQGSNLFSSGTLYASFSTTAFGDIVADHTANVDGSTGAVTNEQFIITHKVAVSSLQVAQSYTTTVYYIITGIF